MYGEEICTQYLKYTRTMTAPISARNICRWVVRGVVGGVASLQRYNPIFWMECAST